MLDAIFHTLWMAFCNVIFFSLCRSMLSTSAFSVEQQTSASWWMWTWTHLAPLRPGATSKILLVSFASGMTSILGKLVQGWMGLSKGESDEVGRQFRNVTRAGASWPIGARGRYEYNSSQEFDVTKRIYTTLIPGTEIMMMRQLSPVMT